MQLLNLLFWPSLAAAATAAVFRPPIPSPHTPSGFQPQHRKHRPTKTCTLHAPRSTAVDSTPQLLTAFKRCNKGGIVLLPRHVTLTLHTYLDLTFLSHVDFHLLGTLQFAPNITYWTSPAGGRDLGFQNTTAFWKIGGKDVNIYGGGTGVIDGIGAPWYREYEKDVMVARPTLFVLDGLKGGSVSRLTLQYAPKWYNFVLNSEDVVFDGVKIWGETNYTGSNPTVNLDGWDTYRSNRIVIQNADVRNDDDCVSFKPNSTNIVVQNMRCDGSHGMSIGSLGQYPGVYDIVENVTVWNTTMSNAAYAARIKVWPGVSSTWTPDLAGGGGLGRVKNVVFDGFTNIGNDEVITITQCFGQANRTLCEMFPSNLTIHDVVFRNIRGTSSGKLTTDGKLGTVVCSQKEVCGGIRAQNVTVTPPRNGTQAVDGWYGCQNIDEVELGLTCRPDLG